MDRGSDWYWIGRICEMGKVAEVEWGRTRRRKGEINRKGRWRLYKELKVARGAIGMEDWSARNRSARIK